MAVHRTHSHTAGIARHQHARHIAVGVQGQLQLLRRAACNVVTPHADRGIHFAGDGIFIGIVARIVGKLLALRLHTLELRHRVLLHLTLVVAHPYQMAAVGREHHCTVVAELLFVHPVGNTIDNLVANAVSSYLLLFAQL